MSSSNSSAQQDAEHELDFTVSCIGVVPFVLVVWLYYMTKRTDDKRSYYAIHFNLVTLSSVHIVGSFIVLMILLIIRVTDGFTGKSEWIRFLYKLFTNLLIHGSLIVATIFYYLIFISSMQRFMLLTIEKLGRKLMTGARLTFNMTMLYFVAIISAINKIFASNKIPWLEMITMVLSLIMLLLSIIIIRHIDKRSRSGMSAHVTVLLQTVPIAILLMVFTVAKFYVLTSGQTNINLITFQSFMTFSISFMTPIFLIIGSLNKRKVAVAILTCQRGTRIIGGEVYTAERSPATMSHVVSMVPTRI
ncbi:Serpentine Receptor, class Z [Caenorhabditis elegans]|uniref:Serpentine Receptor, class Z n=1 Tax=Caenorhabditis elegans TaxID=6239 RepID=Q20434_CAEEL|nr:Serpentine Receptor, class Z [Caenorhabditis elegans]CAA92177.2 Serpentine Receptor, class Z [Caenorhabditis elegans]|eukprot:NP_510093.2 Uncharacterized protein CELE_F45E6.1 [Caenorhabditis elegans]